MPPRVKKSVHERSNNTTHGLVPPSKKVTKHKIDSNLNGHPHKPNGHVDVTTSPSTSTAAVNAQTPTAPPPDTIFNGNPSEDKMGASISHHHGRLRTGSEGSLDDLEAHGMAGILGPPLRIDVKAVGK